MKQDSYKKLMFKKWLMPKIIGAAIIFMIIIITIIIVNMQERSQIYLEGAAKAIPLLKNEKMKMLGDLYLKLNNDFEQEIKNYELSYANRTNKRGDKIYYGVNGKENIDEMINDDYVNGIASVKYVKGSASNRHDGDSNFVDMVSFMTESLGVDIDKYDHEQLKSLFTDLFKLTHTFSGTSTELYPCDHGCAWCKYYCGDIACQGTVGGETVGYYKCDMFLGQEGKYGLMYDPFLISKQSNYQALKDMAANEREMKTTYQYKDVKITYTSTDDGVSENHSIVTKGDTVVSQDDEIYYLNEPDGYCPVCSGRRRTFTSTTRKFGGCDTHVKCHCTSATSKHLYRDSDDETGYWVDWHMGSNKGTCDEFNVEEADCSHECECDGECTHTCADPVLQDTGYYVCEGHDHYACPGHIIVCCFGHTNLNLEVKIMYHQEMIETIFNLIN